MTPYLSFPPPALLHQQRPRSLWSNSYHGDNLPVIENEPDRSRRDDQNQWSMQHRLADWCPRSKRIRTVGSVAIFSINRILGKRRNHLAFPHSLKHEDTPLSLTFDHGHWKINFDNSWSQTPGLYAPSGDGAARQRPFPPRTFDEIPSKGSDIPK